MSVAPKKQRRERIYMRISKGAIIPADACALSKLRERGYRVGDLVVVDLCKPRNPKFNGLVHKLGMLVVENIPAFAGIESHAAIKRLQLEGKVACEEIGYMIPGYGMAIQFIPRSLSFESMDEAAFKNAAMAICRTISERYWPDMSPERIENMAELMVLE